MLVFLLMYRVKPRFVILFGNVLGETVILTNIVYFTVLLDTNDQTTRYIRKKRANVDFAQYISKKKSTNTYTKLDWSWKHYLGQDFWSDLCRFLCPHVLPMSRVKPAFLIFYSNVSSDLAIFAHNTVKNDVLVKNHDFIRYIRNLNQKMWFYLRH